MSGQKCKEDLVIFTIAGSKEGDALIRRSGFHQTSVAVDPKTGNNYPFYEITLGELKSRILPYMNNSILENAPIVSSQGKQLTPITQ